MPEYIFASKAIAAALKKEGYEIQSRIVKDGENEYKLYRCICPVKVAVNHAMGIDDSYRTRYKDKLI